ncbi:MAG: isopentenyl phosphate kinase [Methermicoccaceae archaeon]
MQDLVKERVRILKLGGSILTYKDMRIKRIRRRVLMDVAEAISDCSCPLVLVHGAGSFGHPEAKRYSSGFDAHGISETHWAVLKLNMVLVETLIKMGVNAVPLSPLSSSTSSNGRISTFMDYVLKEMVDMGCVPVLHGDVVIDEGGGACVISGDQLLTRVARLFPTPLVGSATATEGILDKDGNTIGCINSLEQVYDHIYDVDDVTGGMLGKIDELLKLAEEGTDSWIFSGMKPDGVRAFLGGVPIGTHITIGHDDSRLVRNGLGKH